MDPAERHDLVLVGRERLLQPARPGLGEHRQHGADVGDRVAAVRVGQQRDVGAEGGPQRTGPFGIRFERVAEPQLDGAVAGGDLAERLVGDRARRGVAEREAAGVGGHLPGGPAEQPVKGDAERLARQVPQGHVDAAHRAHAGGAGAVIGEHPALEDVPDSRGRGGVHAGEQVAQGRVDGRGDGERSPAVVRLAVPGQSVGGGDLDDHRVSLGDRAEALGDRLAQRNGDGQRLD